MQRTVPFDFDNSFPLVWRELKSKTRTAAHRAGRSKTAAISMGIVLLWIAMAQSTGAANGWLGVSLLKFLTFLGCLVGVLTGTSVAADEFIREKEEGTLGLLLLAPLTSRSLVAGKLAGNTLVLVWNILAMGPLLAFPLSMGGVSGGDCLACCALVLSSGILAAAAAMRTSIQAGSLGTAKARALVWFVCIVVFGLMAVGILLLRLIQARKALARVRQTNESEPESRGFAKDLAWVCLGAGFAVFTATHFSMVVKFMFLSAPAWALASSIFSGGIAHPVLVASIELLALIAVAWLFIELAATELETMRWSGKGDSSNPDGTGVLQTSEVRTSHQSRPSLTGRLLEPNAGAVSMAWLIITCIALRACFVSDTPLSLSAMMFQVGIFEVTRPWMLLLCLPIAWQICRGCVAARKSGLWEMIRISPLTDGECIDLTMRKTIRKMGVRPLLLMHIPGVIYLVLLTIFGGKSPGWLELVSFLIIGLRLWMLLEILGWASLHRGLSEASTRLAVSQSLLSALLLPWIRAMLLFFPILFALIFFGEITATLQKGHKVGFGLAFLMAGIIADWFTMKKMRAAVLKDMVRPSDPFPSINGLTNPSTG